MAERTPDPVVPVLGKRAAAVALALKRAAAGQDRHHRHVLVSKGLLPEATAEAAALPDGRRWRRNLPSTAT
jgi:hypothetical protein